MTIDREKYFDALKVWVKEEHYGGQEDNPYAPFRSKLPASILNSLNAEERELLDLHERDVFAKEQKIAQAKGEQLRAWTAAGGDAEDFRAAWDEGGCREEAIADIAAEHLANTYTDNVF